MKDKKSIIIAGAGIGGTVTAILLQRAGFSVSVFEKLNDCGERFHGDWQGIENWSSGEDISYELKILGIDITDIIVPIRHFTVFSHIKTSKLNSSNTVFYLVKRGSAKGTLDHRLKVIAQQCGVQFFFNTPVKNTESVDVIATGPNPKSSIFIAKGITFTTDCPNEVAVYLNTKHFPYGYAYFLTINSQATLAVCGKKNIFQKRKTLLNDAILFFQNKFGQFKIENCKNFGGYGVMPFSDIFSSKKPFVIGEAAGLQDNLLGFGMRYAFKSAIAASECIAHGVPYDIFFRKELAPTVRISRFWGKIMFGALKNPGIHLMCMLAEKDCKKTLKFFYNPILTKIAGKICF